MLSIITVLSGKEMISMDTRKTTGRLGMYLKKHAGEYLLGIAITQWGIEGDMAFLVFTHNPISPIFLEMASISR